MRLVVRSLLVFFLLLPVFAAQNDLYITVGTFKSKSRADAQLLVLKKAMEKRADIARLRKVHGFDYAVEQRNGFNLVVITPFQDSDVLQTVIDASRETFPDAFARRYKTPPPAVKATRPAEAKKTSEPEKRQEIEKSVDTSPVIVPVEVVEQVSDDEETAKKTSDDMDSMAPIVPYIQESSREGEVEVRPSAEDEPLIEVVEKKIPASEPAEIVRFDEQESVIDTTSSPATVDDLPSRSNVMLYAIMAAIIALLLLIVVWVFRRSKAEKELKEPFAFNEKVISPLDVETPLREDEKPEGKIVPPAATSEKMVTPEVPDLAIATPAPVVPPVDEIKKSTGTSRKKRESSTKNIKKRKDDLKEFSGNRLLVAEDNLINQKVISSLLAGSGIDVVIANNGQEALDILEKDSDFQMILMDAHMPVKDGYQASQDIRDEPKYDHIPIVALSGDISPDDIKKMKKAGMEEQLSKPLRIDALYDVMYCYFDIDTADEVSNDLSGTMQDTDSLKVSKGIDISGGDEGLYKEILSEFVETYGSSDHTLDGYFVHDDVESAKALLLDIRGIAANIGAEQLSETAEELREAILDESEVKYNALFEKYREQLYFLLSDIKAI